MTNNLPNTAGVFSITFTFSNYAYVGWSENMKKGAQTIFSQLAHNRHRSADFQALYDEFGADAFYVRKLADTETEEVGKRLRGRLINSNQYSLNKTGRDPEKDAVIETFHTPWGDFTDAKKAAWDGPWQGLHCHHLYPAFFEPDRVITDADYLAYFYDVPSEQFGKTFADLGFGSSLELVPAAQSAQF